MGQSDDLDWALIRSVLAVADTGSLSAAARLTGQSQPTLGRHIRAAEAHFGQPIFARHARGLVPTEFGQSLLPAMAEMRRAARSLSVTAAGQDPEAEGSVRLTASKFVSAFLLPPILAGFRKTEPGIHVELVASDTSDNLLFHEADLAVRMYKPTQLDMITRRLGELPLGLFASDAYLARRGMPEHPEELHAHDVLGYDRDDRIIQGFRELGWDVDRDFFSFRCDDQVIYWQYVVAGLGIGVGQTRVAEQYPDVRKVLPDLALPTLPVWLTAHPALRHTPRVARLWSALEEGLSPLLS